MIHTMEGKGVALRGDLCRDKHGNVDPRLGLDWMRAAGCKWAILEERHQELVTAYAMVGVPTFAGGLVDQWRPDTWRATLAKIDKLERLAGIAPNTERGWHRGHPDVHALAAALAERAKSGLTIALGTFEGLEPFVRELDRAICDLGAPAPFVMPETYNYQLGSPSRVARVCRAWLVDFPGRVRPYVGSLPAHGHAFDAGLFAREYDGLGAELRSVDVPGACVFYSLPAPRGPLLDHVRGWSF